MKLDGLDTPSVLVDVDIMTANLDRLAAYCRNHGLNLRPHVKTHKNPELAQLQIRKGAVGVTVAKLGEAEVMADGGIEDILLAYPVYGEIKWKRLAALARRTRISVALDSLEVAQGISKHARESGVRIPILVEFDTGMRRCGFAIGKEAIPVVERIAELPALDYQGLLIYPGHFLKDPERRKQLLAVEKPAAFDSAGPAGRRRDPLSGHQRQFDPDGIHVAPVQEHHRGPCGHLHFQRPEHHRLPGPPI